MQLRNHESGTARPPPKQETAARWPDLLMLAIVLAASLLLVLRGAEAMNYHWQWYRVPAFFVREIDGASYPGPLLRGLIVTAEIIGLSMLLTLVIGCLTAFLRMSPSWAGWGLATLYLELVRNTPLLIQIFVFYFVLAPLLGISRFWVGVLSLSLFEATFAAEVIRGSILAVPRGQWEAARAMGFRSWPVLRLVVLPQAATLMLPPLTSVLVNLVKNSAIVSVIAIPDLATEGRNLVSDTLMSFEIWLSIAAVYLAITIPLSFSVQWLESRLVPAR